MSNSKTLECYKGDTKTITVTVKDEDGNNQNITGTTIVITVKSLATDDDADKKIQKTFTVKDQSVYLGQAAVTLSVSDTDIPPGTYVYDIELTDGVTPDTRQTIAKGLFKVKQDVFHHDS